MDATTACLWIAVLTAGPLERLAEGLPSLVKEGRFRSPQDLREWQEVEAEPATVPSAWQVADGWLVGIGRTAGWHQIVGPVAAPAAGVLMLATLVIDRPAPDLRWEGGQEFCNYQAGRHDAGYDAGLVVNWTDRHRFYRLALSARYQEIALWKPHGGFLAVAPARVPVGRPIDLAVRSDRGHLQVHLAGQPVLDYHDTLEPLQGGRAGLAVFHSRCRFGPLQIAQVPSLDPGPARPHQPQLTLRPWRWMDWIFDGLTPVAHLDRDQLVLWEARLGRPYKPLAFWELFWKQYDGPHNSARCLEDFQVLESGRRLVVALRSQNPGRQFTSRLRLTVGYDPATDGYLYDVETRLDVNAGQTWTYTADGLEYGNLLPYNVVPASTPAGPAWPWEYQWILFQGLDSRIYKQPLHHNGVPVAPVKPDGGFFAYVSADRPAPYVPAVELENPPDPELNGYAGLCHWSFDVHLRYAPFSVGQAIPAGRPFRARYRVIGLRPAHVEALWQQAGLAPGLNPGQDMAAYLPGLNTFDAVRRSDQPHPEWCWRGGRLDSASGRTDRWSLRLDNPTPRRAVITCLTGSSFFMPGYGDGPYEMVGWIRTQDVRGPGATLLVRDPQDREDRAPTRVAGTRDWTRVSFRPHNVNRRTWMLTLGLELDGAGTAWFDDVEIREVPLEETRR